MRNGANVSSTSWLRLSPSLIFLLAALGSANKRVESSVIEPQDSWEQGIYPTFIAFTYGRSMLEQTLAGYKNVNWPGIVIVDNSRAREALRDCRSLQEKYGVYQVIETQTQLAFSQLQNTFNWYARKWNVSWYFWSHSDALLVPDPNISHYAEAMRCINGFAQSQPSFALAFFQYDYLAACQTKAFHEVPWDTGITHYFSDCDVYYRLRHKGYSTANCRIGTLFNMPDVMNPTLLSKALERSNNEDDHLQRVELVQDFLQANKGNSYHWRNNELDSLSRQTEAEKKAFAAHTQASRVYFHEKYTDGISCGFKEWGGKPPNFDV